MLDEKINANKKEQHVDLRTAGKNFRQCEKCDLLGNWRVGQRTVLTFANEWVLGWAKLIWPLGEFMQPRTHSFAISPSINDMEY